MFELGGEPLLESSDLVEITLSCSQLGFQSRRACRTLVETGAQLDDCDGISAARGAQHEPGEPCAGHQPTTHRHHQ